jgi:hypothetical protein
MLSYFFPENFTHWQGQGKRLERCCAEREWLTLILFAWGLERPLFRKVNLLNDVLSKYLF